MTMSGRDRVGQKVGYQNECLETEHGPEANAKMLGRPEPVLVHVAEHVLEQHESEAKPDYADRPRIDWHPKHRADMKFPGGKDGVREDNRNRCAGENSPTASGPAPEVQRMISTMAYQYPSRRGATNAGTESGSNPVCARTTDPDHRAVNSAARIKLPVSQDREPRRPSMTAKGGVAQKTGQMRVHGHS